MNLLRAQENVGSDSLRHVHHEQRGAETQTEVRRDDEGEVTKLARFKGRLALTRTTVLNNPVDKED